MPAADRKEPTPPAFRVNFSNPPENGVGLPV